MPVGRVPKWVHWSILTSAKNWPKYAAYAILYIDVCHRGTGGFHSGFDKKKIKSFIYTGKYIRPRSFFNVPVT